MPPFEAGGRGDGSGYLKIALFLCGRKSDFPRGDYSVGSRLSKCACWYFGSMHCSLFSDINCLHCLLQASEKKYWYSGSMGQLSLCSQLLLVCPSHAGASMFHTKGGLLKKFSFCSITGEAGGGVSILMIPWREAWARHIRFSLFKKAVWRFAPMPTARSMPHAPPAGCPLPTLNAMACARARARVCGRGGACVTDIRRKCHLQGSSQRQGV
jgi:hypothetical protein